MSYIKKSLQSFYINKFSKKFSARFLILESDDWGTIRMNSTAVYQSLSDAGYPLSLCPYTRNDALESNDDMELLLEVLSSVKDANNKPAVLTANWIAANPDFSRIRDADYSAYFFEPSVLTLQRYPNADRVHQLQREGLHSGIFFPQFHGREHVHVYRWLMELKNQNRLLQQAFDAEMISFNTSQNPGCEADYMDVYNAWNETDMNMSLQSIKEGLNMFKETWGYTSQTAIAPCYYWHPQHERMFSEMGVELLQGMLVQKQPILQNGSWRKKYHHTGQTNRIGQKYGVRNVMFEPSLTNDDSAVPNALKSTRKAFESYRPAIVSTHRLNYIGRIDPNNRDKGLMQLHEFLSGVVKEWPDVQFIHSAQFADLLFDRKLSIHD
jgi:hypothetical protein